MNNSSEERIVAMTEEVSGLTVQDEAMLEFGRRLLLNSVEDGRSFCQQMITIATSAIPVYLGLLKLWFADDSTAPARNSIYFAAPVFLFLFATVSFLVGYLPRWYEISIGSLEKIESTRLKLMQHRAVWGSIGFLLFCLGILVSVLVMLFLT